MCHVLIIEDEPLIALDIEGILAGRGATSFAFAETEADAVEEAARRPPALITADILLREGNGVRAVTEIAALLGRIPVIFVTATPDAWDSPHTPSRLLRKPLNENALAEAFDALRPA